MDRDVESLVSDSIGDSVTPSRLLNPGDVGVIRKLLGHESVETPVHEYLKPNEQPHYLFHTTSSLSFPEEQEPDEDGALSIRERTFVSPAVAVVTDRRVVFIYKSGDDDRVISLPHDQISSISYHDTRIENKMEIESHSLQYTFGMWVTDPYAEEIESAVVLAADKSEIDYERTHGYSDIEDYEAARAAFQEQFDQLKGISEQIDTKRVVSNGFTAANTMSNKDKRLMIVSFTVAAGYTIYDELSDGANDAREVVEGVDEEHLASRMVEYQRAANRIGDERLDVLGGAVGATVALAEASPERDPPALLSSLDVDWATRQLTNSDDESGAIQVASEVIDEYADDVAAATEEDWLDDME